MPPIGLALAIASPGYAQDPVDGLWYGVDSRGIPLSFVVTDGGTKVRFLSFDTSCMGLVEGSSHPIAVSESHFSASFSRIYAQQISCLQSASLDGTFVTTTTASGLSRSSSIGACTSCSDERSWAAFLDASVVVADLAVTITDGREVTTPDAATTYEIQVTNHGPQAVSTFHLSAGHGLLYPEWSVSNGNYGPSSGTWVGPSLGPGTSLTFRLSGYLDPYANQLTAACNVSVSTIGAFDPDSPNNHASDATPVRTLAITLTGSTVAATPPTTIALVTSLGNEGPTTAENVQVAFSTPPGLTFLENTGDCTTPFPCALGTIPPSSERRVTTLVELPQGYAGPDPVIFSMAATTTTSSLIAPNNTAQWLVSVVRPQPSAFHVVEPCRLLDTRASTPISAGAGRVVAAAGSCGVPASARALALNVTVVQPTGDGDVRLSPGLSQPPTSTINFRAGQTRANNAVIAVSEAGALSIWAAMTSGSVHVLLDVNGYFE